LNRKSGEKRRRGEEENWKQAEAAYRIPQTENLLQDERMLKTEKK